MNVSSWVSHPLIPRVSIGLGVILFVIGLAWIMRLVVTAALLPPAYNLDFDYYMHAGRTIAQGENPYTLRAPMLGDIHVMYPYPPLLAWVLAPLVTVLPLRYPFLVWVVLELVGFGFALILALRSGVPPVRWHWVILVLGAATLPFIVRDNLFHGQVDFLLALLVTGGLVLLSRDRPVLAGIAFASAANVKPFLVVLLLYLAWRCRWRAFFAMGISGAVILVASFLPHEITGNSMVGSWLGNASEVGRPPYIGFPYNLSLYGLVVRTFTQTSFAEPWIVSHTLYLACSLVLAVIPIAVLLLTVPPGRPRRPNDPLMIFVEGGLVLTLMFACGPIAEANHLLSLAPVAIAVLRLAFGSPDAVRRHRWLPAAIAWIVLLVAILGPLKVLSWTDSIAGVPAGIQVLFTGRVGFLLLAAALTTAWSLHREHAIDNPHLSWRRAISSMRARLSGRPALVDASR